MSSAKPLDKYPAMRLWVQCDVCNKWRRLPLFVDDGNALPESWTCSMNEFDKLRASCSAEQEPMGDSPSALSNDPDPLDVSEPTHWDALVIEKLGKGLGFYKSTDSSAMPIQSSAEVAIKEAIEIEMRDASGEASVQHIDYVESHGASVGHHENVSLKEKPPAGSLWLAICFVGIMVSFVLYALVMEGVTKDHHISEVSLIFLTSTVYTLTAFVGKKMNKEPDATIPTFKMMLVSLMSLASSWFSIRSLRYVIFPIQVLAKSCKAIPVMLFGVALGKRYSMRKYVTVLLVTGGVAIFMLANMKHKQRRGGKSAAVDEEGDDDDAALKQLTGIFLLLLSLFFDGGTGALEDRFMAEGEVGAFDLMFHIQLGKAVVAGAALLLLGRTAECAAMLHEMPGQVFLLGLTGAMGQVFIFVTISKFGALTCAIIGLTRKVVTLLASFLFYSHPLNQMQALGLGVTLLGLFADFAREDPAVTLRRAAAWVARTFPSLWRDVCGLVAWSQECCGCGDGGAGGEGLASKGFALLATAPARTWASARAATERLSRCGAGRSRRTAALVIRWATVCGLQIRVGYGVVYSPLRTEEEEDDEIPGDREAPAPSSSHR